MRRKHSKQLNPCPIVDCNYESPTFIDLLRHMVDSERRNVATGHQGWLTEALDAEFEKYAFKKDSRVANLFAIYYHETSKNLPVGPSIFNAWFENYKRRKHYK